MIVEINDTLININNVCSAKKCYQTTDEPGRLKPSLHISFINGKTEIIQFKNNEDMQVGYHTIRLFETVINKNKKR